MIRGSNEGRMRECADSQADRREDVEPVIAL